MSVGPHRAADRHHGPCFIFLLHPLRAPGMPLPRACLLLQLLVQSVRTPHCPLGAVRAGVCVAHPCALEVWPGVIVGAHCDELDPFKKVLGRLMVRNYLPDNKSGLMEHRIGRQRAAGAERRQHASPRGGRMATFSLLLHFVLLHDGVVAVLAS